MTFSPRPASPAPLAVTRRARPNGVADIDQMQWHATRGPTSMVKQVAATENWLSSAANGRKPGTLIPRNWGASADAVVGPDYRRDGRITIAIFGDWLDTWSSFSAGYGPSGWRTEYPAAERGFAVEVAQPMGRDAQGRYTNDPDAAFENFTDDTIDACVWLTHWVNERIEQAGGVAVPAERIPSWDQRRDHDVPRGHLGHEDLANGVRLGKSDPGHLFPWDDLMRRVAMPVAEQESEALLALDVQVRMIDRQAATLVAESRALLTTAQKVRAGLDRVRGEA